MKSSITKYFWACCYILIAALLPKRIAAQEFNTLIIDTLKTEKIHGSLFVEINNDHYRDFITVVESNSNIKAFIYLQTDSLQFELTDSITGLSSPSIIVTDIDNTGQQDLIYQTNQNNNQSLEILANYEPENSTITTINIADSIVQTAIIDIDQNGQKELAVIINQNNENQLHIYSQHESLSFEFDTIIGNADKIMPVKINDDGLFDWLIYSQEKSSILTLYRNSINELTWDTLSISLDYDLKDWAISDVNHDGDLDLITADETDINVISFGGDTTFYRAIWQSDFPLEKLSSADINNDGFYDIVISNHGNSELLLLDESGNVSDNVSSNELKSVFLSSFGDVDHNGILDFHFIKDTLNYKIQGILLNSVDQRNEGPKNVNILTPVTIANETTFSWRASEDDATPSLSLTYDFFIESIDENRFVFTSDHDLDNVRQNGFRNSGRHGITLFNTELVINNLNSGKNYWGVSGVDNSFHSETDIRNCNGGELCLNELFVSQCLEIIQEETEACLYDTLTLQLGTIEDSVLWFSKHSGGIGSGNTIKFVVNRSDTVYAISKPKFPCDSNEEICFLNYSLSIKTNEPIDLFESVYGYCPGEGITISPENTISEIVWYNQNQILSTNVELAGYVPDENDLFVRAKIDTEQCYVYDTIKFTPFENIRFDLIEEEQAQVCLGQYFYPTIAIPDSLQNTLDITLFYYGNEVPPEGVLIHSDVSLVFTAVLDQCHELNDTIFVKTIPPPSISIQGNSEVYPGKSTQLTASGATNYSWSPDIFISSSSGATVNISPQYSIEYVLSGWDDADCSSDTTIMVEVVPSIYIPELFTPNGDGNNDHLLIYGNEVKDISFSLFNGDGKRVYHTNSVSEITRSGWDGQNNGRLIAPGTHVWTVNGSFANNTPVTFEGKTRGELKVVR